MLKLTVQALGFLGTGFGVYSFQCRTHRKIMVCRTGCEMMFAIQYVLLGAYTGAVMNLLGSARNMLFAAQVRRGKKTLAGQVLFSLLFLLGGLLTWNGVRSLIVIFAKIISTFGYGMRNLRLLRLCAFLSSGSWLIYNIAVGSVGGSLNEALAIVSLSVATVRAHRVPA